MSLLESSCWSVWSGYVHLLFCTKSLIPSYKFQVRFTFFFVLFFETVLHVSSPPRIHTQNAQITNPLLRRILVRAANKIHQSVDYNIANAARATWCISIRATVTRNTNTSYALLQFGRLGQDAGSDIALPYERQSYEPVGRCSESPRQHIVPANRSVFVQIPPPDMMRLSCQCR
jgi:hypothetical protein